MRRIPDAGSVLTFDTFVFEPAALGTDRADIDHLKKGQLTCFYLMWYSVGRLFIEYLRTDSLMLGRFKVAQLVSIAMFLFGLVYFVYLCFNKLSKDQYYNKKMLVSYEDEEIHEEKEKTTKKVIKKKSK